MAKPKSITWTVYKIAAKRLRPGTVAAADKREAIQKAAEEFKQPATKLYAVRRSRKGSGDHGGRAYQKAVNTVKIFFGPSDSEIRPSLERDGLSQYVELSIIPTLLLAERLLMRRGSPKSGKHQC
jgi:hypothetical protein